MEIAWAGLTRLVGSNPTLSVVAGAPGGVIARLCAEHTALAAPLPGWPATTEIELGSLAGSGAHHRCLDQGEVGGGQLEEAAAQGVAPVRFCGQLQVVA